jgi:membrane protein implicated in regulation of membrane protease activity
MPWWGWLIIGLLLFGSELLIVDAAFYLVFIGVAAILTGLLAMTGLVTVYWVQWLLFSVLALVSMVFFRKRLYAQLRGRGAEYQDGMVGEIIRLEQSLAPGESGRLIHRGTTWTVANRGSELIAAGSDVKIDKTDGLTIIVTGKQ